MKWHRAVASSLGLFKLADTPKKYICQIWLQYICYKRNRNLFSPPWVLLRHSSESQLMWIFMLVFAVLSPLTRDWRDLYRNGCEPSSQAKELGMPHAVTVCTSIWKSQDFSVDTTKTLKSLSLTLPQEPIPHLLSWWQTTEGTLVSEQPNVLSNPSPWHVFPYDVMIWLTVYHMTPQSH